MNAIRSLIACNTALVVGALACMHAESTGPTYRFDLSTESRIMAFEFPADAGDGSPFFADTDHPQLFLQLAGERVFHQRLEALFITKVEEVLEIKAHLEQKSVEAAFEEARNLSEYWGIPTGNLEEWYEAAAVAPWTADIFRAGTALPAPSFGGEQAVAVEVLRSYSKDEPWFVQFKFVYRDPQGSEERGEGLQSR